MHSLFELESDFKNGWNRIYAFFAEFKIFWHMPLTRRHSK